MVASATIHELLLFIFESVKLKKLNFWSIFMQWLKTCLKLSLMRVFDMPTKNQHLSCDIATAAYILQESFFKG
jgi:hypothetical protein